MYKIGDKLEVATVMLTMDIPWETKIMTLTNIIYSVNIYYCFDGNDNHQYPIGRIIRKIEEEIII